MHDPKILIGWIGMRDLGVLNAAENADCGPIAMAVDAGEAFATNDGNWTEVNLISDKAETECSEYVKWLQSQTSAKVIINYTKPIIINNFGQIYEYTLKVIKVIEERYKGKRAVLVFHVGYGNWSIAAVFIIIVRHCIKRQALLMHGLTATIL